MIADFYHNATHKVQNNQNPQKKEKKKKEEEKAYR